MICGGLGGQNCGYVDGDGDGECDGGGQVVMVLCMDWGLGFLRMFDLEVVMFVLLLWVLGLYL